MPPGDRSETREWNAEVYHRVSNPQLAWGTAVLDRLPLVGNELVIDVGCGTGRLTTGLVERLPLGRVIGVDRSANMLRGAREHLRPFGARVAFVRADAAALPCDGIADAIFSTATFHWVREHDELFASVFRALVPGGRLVAQCGGGPNIERIRMRAARLMADPMFAPHFRGWTNPWEFASAATTEGRLAAAGFAEVSASVEPAPVVQQNAADYREFLANVICHPHLACLADGPELQARFLDALTSQAANDDPPFELDYWRLNLQGRKPS
jgi:trans-aconitate 2-methyltransferase